MFLLKHYLNVGDRVKNPHKVQRLQKSQTYVRALVLIESVQWLK